MSPLVDPWQEYRKRRNLALFAFFGYMPIIFLVGMVSVHLFHMDTPFYVAAFSWMVLYAIAGFRWASFPCPRCHQGFFFRWWPPPPPISFVQRCLHCDLPKYADPKAAQVKN